MWITLEEAHATIFIKICVLDNFGRESNYPVAPFFCTKYKEIKIIFLKNDIVAIVKSIRLIKLEDALAVQVDF